MTKSFQKFGVFETEKGIVDLLVAYKPSALWEASILGSIWSQYRKQPPHPPPSPWKCVPSWAHQEQVFLARAVRGSMHELLTLKVYVHWAFFWDPCLCLDFQKKCTQIRLRAQLEGALEDQSSA